MSVDELGDIDKAITSAVQRRHRSLAVTAAAGVTCVAIAAAVFFGTGPGNSQPEPLSPPTPTPDSAVKGLPSLRHLSRVPPGEYALDRCYYPTQRKRVCGLYNPFDASGQVNIRFTFWPFGVGGPADAGSGRSNPVDGTSVVVAGYDGIYRKVDDGHERWLVDMAGTSVAIDLVAKPGASQAELVEAHAILDSLRTEPSDPVLSFNLLFTLPSTSWYYFR
jgi:hypothetical protein